MSSHLDIQKQTEKHLLLWIYFLPLVGVIPAVWTLYRTRERKAIARQNNPLENYPQLQQQIEASRLSVNLTLTWLCSYILLSYGSATAIEIASFRFLYANAVTTTGYFIACTFMMSRIGKKRFFLTK